ncbi:MAG TPA: hypothetical protein DCG54_07630 [Anaerolineae bacterium]|jgi:hypothetical protein|nr:hypothetical protein [Anaerolineae bacterium]
MDAGVLERMEQAKLARAETLAQYRAGQYHEITLGQSNLTVFVRDASITDLMLLGKLPQTLINMIVEEADGKDEAVDLSQFAGSDMFGALVNGVVRACVVEPPIEDKPGSDCLGIEEISGDDRMQIFEWANREVAPMAKKFREKSGKPDRTAQHRRSVRRAPVVDTADAD